MFRLVFTDGTEIHYKLAIRQFQTRDKFGFASYHGAATYAYYHHKITLSLSSGLKTHLTSLTTRNVVTARATDSNQQSTTVRDTKCLFVVLY